MSARTIRVAVPLPLDQTFDYALPEPLQAGVGQRVLVPHGRRKLVGFVVGTRDGANPQDGAGARRRALRPVLSVLDPEPVLSEALVQVVLEAARESFSPPGLAFRAAVPPGATPVLRERVALSEAGRRALEGGQVPAPWRAGLAALERPVPLDGLRRRHPELAAGLAQLERLGWLERGAPDAPRSRVQPRVESHYRLAPGLPANWREALARAPRRRALIEQLSRSGPVPLASSPALRALLEAGFVQREQRERPRIPDAAAVEVAAAVQPPRLTPHQRAAVQAISGAISQRRPDRFLLYGITGSGKTEVYLAAVEHARQQGRGAIVLVPEISLTHQLVDRFRARFGPSIALLHSGLSAGERFDEWRSLRADRGAPQIAIGARSAIFAPVRELGLIAIDEEHDAAYQSEDAFRYHARDVAELRARTEGCPLVLGSATPDVESAYRARQRELITLRLPERVAERPLPDVQIVDMEQEPRGARILSRALRGALAETLSRRQQAILFVNRRGFASRSYCYACGNALRCKHCDISLVYHATVGTARADRPERGELRCHYCGYREDPQSHCPQCGSRDGGLLGFGTEKLEEQTAALFPGARVARLDRDTSAARGAQQRILGAFHRGETDVLIGTQMVAKGHDVPGVTLVGVVYADLGLHLPHYRAGERCFQLLTQVAGRAGRGDEPGRVIVQTFLPDHYAIALARTHDYPSFFREELARREPHGYPPLRTWIQVSVAGADAAAVRGAAEALAAFARDRAAQAPAQGEGEGEDAPAQVLGPAPAPIERMRDEYHWQLVVLAPQRVARELARALRQRIRTLRAAVQIRVFRGPGEML